MATNPNLADIFSYFAKLNGTAMNSTFSQSLPVPAPWKPVNMIGDTANGTYPMRGYSLFGYSVSLSEDGAWLVVGIPGRTYASLSSSILLQYRMKHFILH